MDDMIDPHFRVDCPSRQILDQIADKWSMMALFVLREPKRFNEIKRRLGGITQRVLTQTLRKLERNGMITRRVLPGSPLGVEYALTPLGHSLEGPFSVLYGWTIENMEMINAAQSTYDGRA
ncbi:winged helix-turn-helix transcriptional regulator [Gluconobacter cerinus]|uniref:HxlR family transcriptional regulator n=1 Tax=Gluconobacter cerinus TaxID=38307 RepID=A0AAV5NCD5_9PROT|nr:helix-turn-helix domain-containing protein [Gluconobacter cerinus]GBR02916.1 MarR family transcriptional regulator [Gluconobacter cerinus NRIC 0229]GLQ61488.1 HxlR family transcriptional regulator [Gluconobacter cerinus]